MNLEDIEKPILILLAKLQCAKRWLEYSQKEEHKQHLDSNCKPLFTSFSLL